MALLSKSFTDQAILMDQSVDLSLRAFHGYYSRQNWRNAEVISAKAHNRSGHQQNAACDCSRAAHRRHCDGYISCYRIGNVSLRLGTIAYPTGCYSYRYCDCAESPTGITTVKLR